MKQTIKFRCLLLLLAFFFFFALIPGWALESERNDTSAGKRLPHRVPGISSKVKVDGILDEKVWQEALVLGLNYEVDPGVNIEPPVKTEFLLVYGSNHLYAAFRSYDPNPSEIQARFTDRDHIWDDDYVGIILDTFNDSRRTYEFYCNPFGIQADQIQGMTGSNREWDAIWNSSGRITENGYIVEMSIPFSSLRFQRKKGEQVWGIDAVRSYPRNLSHSIGLFSRDRSNNCYMCQAEKIIGFRNAKPGKNLEFDPTLSAVFTQERESFPEGKFIKKTGKGDPGLTARWSFTPNLTLNAAANPDFSQVEADTAQLDINVQFALFYPEKRPFFLEGASIFNSRLYAVHTRTLADPNWGIKLTGKEGANALGFFSVQDNVTNLLFPESQSSERTSLDKNNLSTVLRYRRDIGKSSSLGVMITDREGEDYFNRVVGIDGDLKLTKKDKLIFQFLGSQTHYTDQVAIDYDQPRGKFTGSAADIAYFHSTKNVLIIVEDYQIEPKFRADLGFIPQVGIKFFQARGEHFWLRNPGHWYTKLTLGGGYISEKDYNGNLLTRTWRTWFNYFGPLQSRFVLVLYTERKSFMKVEFDRQYLFFISSIRPTGPLYLELQGRIGDQIDYANVRAGKQVWLNGFVQYKLGRRLSFGLDHAFERLKVTGGRLYTANISNIQLVYQFSKRFFLKTILQYVNYDYNPALYTSSVDPKYSHLFSQILFSYKINPQTVLFLGYSDDHYGYQNIPLTQSNRTIFFKIGYALVL
jgi:hypothetical protein